MPHWLFACHCGRCVSSAHLTCSYRILIVQKWSWWRPGVFLTRRCDESPDFLYQDLIRHQLAARHSSPGYAWAQSHLACELHGTEPQLCIINKCRTKQTHDAIPIYMMPIHHKDLSSVETHIRWGRPLASQCLWDASLWRVPHRAAPAGHSRVGQDG